MDIKLSYWDSLPVDLKTKMAKTSPVVKYLKCKLDDKMVFTVHDFSFVEENHPDYLYVPVTFSFADLKVDPAYYPERPVALRKPLALDAMFMACTINARQDVAIAAEVYLKSGQDDFFMSMLPAIAELPVDSVERNYVLKLACVHLTSENFVKLQTSGLLEPEILFTEEHDSGSTDDTPAWFSPYDFRMLCLKGWGWPDDRIKAHHEALAGTPDDDGFVPF